MVLSIPDLDANQTIALFVMTVWMIACLILMIIVTVYSFCQFWRNSSSLINPTYRNLTIIIMICFTLTMCLVIFWYIDRYFLDQYTIWTKNVILVIKDILYYLGNLLFYILLLLRISIPFELNKCIKYSLIIIICIH